MSTGRTAPPGPHVLLIEPTATGGLAAHVRMEQEVLAAAGVRTTRADVHIAPRPGPGDLATLRTLRRLLRDPALGIDAVHAHGLRAAALAGLARGPRGRRPPLVATLHNRIAGGPFVRTIGRMLRAVIRARADVVLVVSPDLAAGLDGVPRLERAVVPAPDGPAPVTSPRDLDAPDARRPLRILVAARLAPQKGLDVLLDAVAHLVREGASVEVDVAGDGPEEPVLRERIRAEALPVRLLGRREDVPSLLEACDLVVSAARWEGQPVFLQEALRAGRPVVATRAGGTELVTGDAARLVAPEDPAALAAAIRALLDPGARREAALAAARRGRELPGRAELTAQLLDVLALAARP